MNQKLRDELSQLVTLPQVQAFFQLIRKGEGTLGDNGYRTMFGGELFNSYTAHPRKPITRTLGGKPITSTAAGAFQFLARTWDECVATLGLKDFSPPSQDLAALFLIWRRKALDAVVNGQVEKAIDLCKNEWASLPGSPYGQPTQKLSSALAFYNDAMKATPITTAPTQPEPPQESPMIPIPLLVPLATTLIEAFTPLAKEKLTKVMEKTVDNPQVAEQVATGVIEAAKAVSGLDNPVQAVAAVTSSSEMLERTESASLGSVDQLIPVIERLLAMDQASVDSARVFNASEPLFFETSWLKFKFIHLLSFLFVIFSGAFVLLKWESLTAELKGAVITLMVIAGWNGVRDYWMGSSDGSARKSEQLARANAGKPNTSN